MHASGEESGAAAGESRRPNPEAVAWYVAQAEALLIELRSRVQSLRVRGGQLAGFAAAVIALGRRGDWYLDFRGEHLMQRIRSLLSRLFARPEPPRPVQPAVPPAGVPLEQTVAPIHFEGDTSSV
jgi:hypothetical protein